MTANAASTPPPETIPGDRFILLDGGRCQVRVWAEQPLHVRVDRDVEGVGQRISASRHVAGPKLDAPDLTSEPSAPPVATTQQVGESPTCAADDAHPGGPPGATPANPRDSPCCNDGRLAPSRLLEGVTVQVRYLLHYRK